MIHMSIFVKGVQKTRALLTEFVMVVVIIGHTEGVLIWMNEAYVMAVESQMVSVTVMVM